MTSFLPPSAMASFSSFLLISAVVSLLLPSVVHSFYLPGVAPRDFHTGDPLLVKVNKLTSTKTQLPYDFYFLNYCKPLKIMNSAENLGEVLRGDRIENSVYYFEMRKEKFCQIACRLRFDAESARSFKEKIQDEYRVNMILDNLPVAVLERIADGSKMHIYAHGFRVGFTVFDPISREHEYFIHNHLSFKVKYHEDLETNSARIVGFEVAPVSINHSYKDWNGNNTRLETCGVKIQDTAARQQIATG